MGTHRLLIIPWAISVVCVQRMVVLMALVLQEFKGTGVLLAHTLCSEE